MLFDLSNILDRERFKRRSNELYKKGCVVELTEKKTQRTLRQNSYLHLLIGWYSMETGNTIEYVKREYFKRLCNREIFARTKQDEYLGEVEVLRSTKECDTGELTLAIERFRTWSVTECGIYLPSPDEREFLQQIELEMNKQKQWL